MTLRIVTMKSQELYYCDNSTFYSGDQIRGKAWLQSGFGVILKEKGKPLAECYKGTQLPATRQPFVGRGSAVTAPSSAREPLLFTFATCKTLVWSSHKYRTLDPSPEDKFEIPVNSLLQNFLSHAQYIFSLDSSSVDTPSILVIR